MQRYFFFQQKNFFFENRNAIIAFCSAHSRCLPTTDGGLAAATADTKRSAGHFRSYPHDTFRVGTAPLAPNRSLCTGILFLLVCVRFRICICFVPPFLFPVSCNRKSVIVIRIFVCYSAPAFYCFSFYIILIIPIKHTLIK